DVFGWGRINVFRSVQLALASLGQHAPFAIDDDVTMLVGAQVTIDVLANDFDVNGDAFTITSFAGVSVQGGVIERVVGGGPGGRDELRYTPPTPGFAGADSFAYTVTDSAGGSDSGTVSIMVLDPSLFRVPENPAHTAPGVNVDYYDFGIQ